MYIQWDDSLLVGIKEIDDQHKKFIGLVNQAYEAITTARGQTEIGNILRELANYAEIHFSTEDKYFDKFQYAGAAEHKMLHDEIRHKIAGLRQPAEGRKIDFDVKFVYFLDSWLRDHLANVDQKYVEFFHQHGMY